MAEILLDTTYLLPILGVGVKLERFGEVFPKLINKYTLLYNPISLVEAKWIIISQARKTPDKREALLARFREGLKILLSNTKLRQTILTNAEIESIADKLLLVHRIPDYFDRLIYATATYYDLELLTEDQELHELTKIETRLKPRRALNWKQLLLETSL